MTVNGIDLYHGNTMPDLSTVDFVIHKATQGARLADPAYAQRIGYARSIGKMVGSYHFMSATDSPTSQATFYVQTAKPMPGDILALDFERDITWQGLSDQAAAFVATEIMHAITQQAPKNRLLLYCNVNTFDTIVAPLAVPCGDGLWIADPNGEPPMAHVMRQYASSNVDYDMTYFDDADKMRAWTQYVEPPVNHRAQQLLFLED